MCVITTDLLWIKKLSCLVILLHILLKSKNPIRFHAVQQGQARQTYSVQLQVLPVLQWLKEAVDMVQVHFFKSKMSWVGLSCGWPYRRVHCAEACFCDFFFFPHKVWPLGDSVSVPVACWLLTPSHPAHLWVRSRISGWINRPRTAKWCPLIRSNNQHICAAVVPWIEICILPVHHCIS